ncbi:hypothetical protein [Roseateles sp.]|uniref:hypothetical protein n=1 Tax=Roseateles sp. TaxID=1971397 RepID=UPI00286BE603|nr:hypothetical protein [Roseateles sp.]
MTKKSQMSAAAAVLAALLASACSKAPEAPPVVAPRAAITVEDVNAAQQGWCDALISIAKAHAEGGDYKAIATAVLSNVYNYDAGMVLFNPTLTFGAQNFRLDKEGAAAYFIGGNPKFPNDSGFALKPWVNCSYTNAGNNAGVMIEGDIAMTMGNVTLIDDKGAQTTVDKFFAFKRGADGKLKIIVHKSALPFAPT